MGTHYTRVNTVGSRQEMRVPMWVFIGFQQRDRQDSQYLNNDTLYKMPVNDAECRIGTEKYPDASILLNYNDDDYLQVCGQIKEVFRAADILQPYLSNNDLRSSNVRVDHVSYNL